MREIKDEVILSSVDFADFERRSGLAGFEASNFLLEKINELVRRDNANTVCDDDSVSSYNTRSKVGVARE